MRSSASVRVCMVGSFWLCIFAPAFSFSHIYRLPCGCTLRIIFMDSFRSTGSVSVVCLCCLCCLCYLCCLSLSPFLLLLSLGAEFLAYFPEYAELYTQCLAEFEGLIATLLLAQAKPNQIRDADADVTAEIHKFAVNLREKHGSPLSERELRDQLLVLDPLVLRSLLPSSMDENPPDRNDPSATEGECRRSKKQRQRAKAERSRLRRERKNK
mmetsp:Transcript_2032/g.4723  ORF Transcript_2032/g.4723 Transcript_2032/m.4723 type:complete len:212 (-) Transcript_2032:22-657(-)